MRDEALPIDVASDLVDQVDPEQLVYEPALAGDGGELPEHLQRIDDEYAANPWQWMCAQVVTVDEAEQKVRAWEPSAEVEDMVTVLEHEPLVAFPKTRRMRATWAVALHVLHGVRYKAARLDLWMSRVLEGAVAVVNSRMALIEDRLVDPRLRRRYSRWRTAKGLIGRMQYARTGSSVWAMATGPDVFRSFTVSRVVIDESEFQEGAHEVLLSALPLAEKGTQLVVISSPNGPTGPLAGIAKSAGFVRFT